MKNDSIVDRVVERLKKQPIGDLITEEDLHDIVKQAIPKVFFEKVIVKDGYHEKTMEPTLISIMREILNSKVSDVVDQWQKDNSELILEHWKKILDQGMLDYVNKLQEARIATTAAQILQPLLKDINEQRARMGLSNVYL